MRAVFDLLSPAGSRAALSTLIFHRVMPVRDALQPDVVTADEFDSICRWLAEWFTVLPLDEAVQRLRRGSLPARAACITFDDGYADNYRVALPILKAHGLSATFFVTTGFLDGGCMWNDKLIEAVRATPLPALALNSIGLPPSAPSVLATDTPAAKYQAIASLLPAVKHLSPEQRAVAVDALVQAAQVQPASLPRDLMMQSAEVRTLHSAGMQVGAHTVGHPILANLSDAEALHEIGASREILQALLGQPVSLFAYPNGRPRDDYTARDTGLAAKIGFDAAFSTAWGVAREGADRFQLPRFTPWDRSRMKFAMRLSLNLASRKAVDRV